ncbi:paraquat-inducible protein B [Albidovulum inexpectatum]|uniref:Paraquat-inducible protein B n=1 Tax=Albidovulum inexpectatum TaxID=196587 RepID=A0A2S5JFH3_9RHOB|nr:MlaD family protein [Albidovulum inexpectatum]PPB80223.1 paraquat-inducible protein B [Albidovulum inexpectatum]
MNDLIEPAEPDIEPARRGFFRNLSLVWLVPIAALIVSLGLAWQSYSQRGVAITITFPNATGVTPGETVIKYRDVVVGTVEKLTFTSDLSAVVVHARVDKDIAPYLDEDAQFWIVSPKVTARGVSGLSTVLSGVYIEGAWDETPGEQKYSFVGADGPPLVQPGRPGKRISLITNDGRLVSEGAPVYFHGIEVGRLEKPRLILSSDTIIVDAFIEAPHDRRLTTATRFWDTSGVSFKIGTGGVSLDFDSLASIIAGGIEFDNLFEGGEPVGPGHVFNIYPDESEARRSLIARTPGATVTVAAQFDESISGLEPGADVTYNGLKVGEVKALSAKAEDTAEGPQVRLFANLTIEPDRLGLKAGATEDEVLQFLEEAVERGLRARLATASIFSSALIVELVELPDAPPAKLDRTAEPLPILPTVPSDLPDFTATAEGVLERINKLPIEDVLNQAISLMASIEQVVRAEGTQKTPDAVLALIEDTRSLVNDEATRALPSDLRAAVTDLRQIVAEMKEAGTFETLTQAIQRADAAVANIETASEQIPALVEDLRALAAKANSLQAEELIASATRVLDSADKLIGTDAARELPPALTGALEEIRAAVAELRKGGAVENLNATMASTRDAAESVAAAVERLPELSARLERLVAQSEALIAAYGDRSEFNDETLATLREVRNAARSVSQLARAIERNPNSLLMGR